MDRVRKIEIEKYSDLVRQFFQAFLSKDRPAVESALADDFTFNGPRHDHTDKAAYFERCFQNGDKFRFHHIEQLFESGSEVLVRYRAELIDGSKFRNTEYIRFEGHKIKKVDVYFGASLTSRPS